MFHYRKNWKLRAKFPKSKTCPFCEVDNLHNPIIKDTKHAYITKNRVPYDLWELREVVEHLMVIPKRHVRSLADLKSQERLEIMNLISEYEAQNFNVYARAVNSKQRTVAHQHTHLIKTKDRQAHGSFTLRKPYWLIKF